MFQTKDRKARKPDTEGALKATVRDSKNMNIKSSVDNVHYQGAKMSSIDSIDMKVSKVRDMLSGDSCMLVTFESLFTYSHPSSHESCGYGFSIVLFLHSQEY